MRVCSCVVTALEVKKVDMVGVRMGLRSKNSGAGASAGAMSI